MPPRKSPSKYPIKLLRKSPRKSPTRKLIRKSMHKSPQKHLFKFFDRHNPSQTVKHIFNKIKQEEKKNAIPKNLANALKKILIQGNWSLDDWVYIGIPIDYFPLQYQPLLRRAKSGKVFNYIAFWAIEADENPFLLLQNIENGKF